MAPPIVLLHPLGADHTFWEPVQELIDGPVIALDLPGHGLTPALPEHTGIAGFSDAVADQLSTIGEPVTLVGLSLGGLVAQHLGATRPELLSSVLLVDTVAVYPEPMQQMWRDRARTARDRGVASLVAPMVTMWFTESLAAADDQRVARAMATFAATDPEGYARSCDLLAGVDLTAVAPAIAVPSTIVCGKDDAAPFLAAAQWLADVTGGVVDWLPGKHACAVESPGEFAKLLVAK